MSMEIELKYLLRESGQIYATPAFFAMFQSVDSLIEKTQSEGTPIIQGYMPLEFARQLAEEIGLQVGFPPGEARLRNNGGKLRFTIKGSGSLARGELETGLDSETFDKYWPSTLGRRIEKRRLENPCQELVAEFDVYIDGRDLVVAEIEVPSLDFVTKIIPLGMDISTAMQYKNKNLAR